MGADWGGAMVVEIFKNIILNISLLVLIAYLLTRIPLVKEFITNDRERLLAQCAMAVFFGLIGILSTYTGIRVNDAIANTRVIGVIAGGLLGGPVVGIGAGVIAGLHRYLIDIGGFTAVACAVSTIVEGLIGGVCYQYMKRANNSAAFAGAVTLAAEIIQMLIILLIARPLEEAWRLVAIISMPMILFNSIGVMIFVGIFDSVFIEQDREAANRIRLVLNIADRCLSLIHIFERDGVATVIAPAAPMKIGRFEKDMNRLMAVYKDGMADAAAFLAKWNGESAVCAGKES